MLRVCRNIRLWWAWILLLTIVIFGVQSKSTMSFEKPTGNTMDLVQVVKEVRGTIVQIVVPLQNSKTRRRVRFLDKSEWIRRNVLARGS